LYLKEVKHFAMRKLRLFTIPVILSIFFFYGCKKNMVDEQFKPIINPVIPDFTTQITASVHGFITDENGEAVEGASITAGAITVTTDEFGYFKINNTSFAKSAGFIQVRQAGYFTGYRTFLPVQGKETFTRLQLIPKTTAGTIESVAGGTATLSSGATVTLPADAVVVAPNNSPYTGQIKVAAHWYDPADMETTSLTMPGDLTGIDSAGHLNVLQTFGMLGVELIGSSGELLQIAAGKKATLHFPLPASLQSIAPATIPLWFFDEGKGVWKQDGQAVKNGSSYNGEVSHFSFWNCDVGLPLVNFTAQLVDTALNPLSNIPVTISSNDIPNLSRTAFTDVNGIVTGLIPANNNLKLGILVPCNQGINAKTITTTNQSVDLGAVVVDLGQYGVLLRGTVTNCSANPVTNGYVMTIGLGNNAIINLNNGVYSAAGIICPGTTINLVAFDRETAQQKNVMDVSINQGINDLGELQICSIASTETINISNSTSTISYTLPQYLFGGNFYFLNDSTSINAIDLLNSNQQVFQLSFAGAASAGPHDLANNRVIRIDSVNWQFDVGTTVNISSYGLIGQFITGTLNGSAVSLTTPSTTTTFNIEFAVKRDQ
jgi:hypothetical protein